MGLPLSVARGIRLPGEAWSPRDWALAQAYRMLDRSRCPGCGEPRWLSNDPRARYTPHKVKCEGCESIAILQATVPEDYKHPQALHFHTEYLGT